MAAVQDPEPPTPEMREALRARLVRIYHDFDFRAGAFSQLTYFSPRDLITYEWADYAGHPLEELRDAVTAWRTNKVCKNGIDAKSSGLMNDLKRGVDRWRAETGYRRMPGGFEPKHKYKNAKEIVSYVSGSLEQLGNRATSIERSSGTLYFNTEFKDDLGHRVFVGIQVKLLYGGVIWGHIGFPYYDDEHEPTQLSIRVLLGLLLCSFLEVDMPTGMIWEADHGKDAFPRIDGFLKIVGTICGYLRTRE